MEVEKRYEIKFLEIGTEKDHVHFLAQSVPAYSPASIVQKIKSITARKIEEGDIIAEYARGSHTVHDIKYHIVWITKYRYEILTKKIAERLRELLIQGCESRGITIVKRNVRKEHVHMLLWCPTHIAWQYHLKYRCPLR